MSDGMVLRGGLEQLLDAGGMVVERMPMLHVIFDRFVAQSVESMRQISPTPAFMTVNSIQAERLGEVFSFHDGNILIAVYQAPAWESRIIIALDHALIFAMIEALLGGDGSEPPYAEQRPLSNVEIKVGQFIIEQAAKTLQWSFANVLETNLIFERIETRVDFATIGPGQHFAVVSKIDLSVLDRGGQIFIVIPQTALNVLREHLARDNGDAASYDPRWSKKIRTEVSKTEVTVRGIIEEIGFSLEDIAQLKVGQILPLQATPQTKVKLECNAQGIFWCQLGQADGLYTLRIDDPVDHEQEFMDDLLPV